MEGFGAAEERGRRRTVGPVGFVGLAPELVAQQRRLLGQRQASAGRLSEWERNGVQNGAKGDLRLGCEERAGAVEWREERSAAQALGGG